MPGQRSGQVSPIIDAFVSIEMPTYDEAPQYLRDAAAGVFRDADMFGSKDPDVVLAEMDAAGVTKAVLSCRPEAPEPMRQVVEAHPGRFVLSTAVDPRQGMRTVRAVERLVREHDVRLVRVVPFMFDLAPNHRAYYPLYAKCVELGVPVSVNTGIPGPPMPAEVQRPIHLDEVCRFFPELVLVMAHGANPWWGEAIGLMQKYPNLYMMTSAWAPRYLPDELIHFVNTRGRGKVMFATDYPALPFERCVREARELPFRDGAREGFLHDTAQRLFWR
jgi:predicted TIM-barrel fold metal-dependent hydrolase